MCACARACVCFKVGLAFFFLVVIINLVSLADEGTQGENFFLVLVAFFLQSLLASLHLKRIYISDNMIYFFFIQLLNF